MSLANISVANSVKVSSFVFTQLFPPARQENLDDRRVVKKPIRHFMTQPIDLNAKGSDDMATEILKIAGSDHPTVVRGPSVRNPDEYPHKLYIGLKGSRWATFLLLIL